MECDFDKTKNFFNELSLTWDEREKHTIVELRDFISFMPIKKGDKVLDVACGTGVISNLLYEKSEQIVDAIDISTEMIKKAKQKQVGNIVNYQVFNFYDLRKVCYDDVVVFNAFPHFVDVNRFVEVAKDVIKSNGYLIIAHNLSRKELDKHHEALDMKISRSLNNVQEEYLAFSKYFIDEKLVDNEQEFIMVLRRK